MAAPRYFDLGLAHGIPGAIAFLARCCEVSAVADDARPLLDGLLSWFLARRRPELETLFPAREIPERDAEPARAGWCYGDAGIAIALRHARAAGAAIPGDVVPELVRRATARPAERCGVADGTFCHGAAGLVQIFTRLEEPAAARMWLDHLLAGRSPEPGVYSGGFHRAAESGPTTVHDLLDGGAGIGLVLIAATTASPEPQWDRAFLLSA